MGADGRLRRAGVVVGIGLVLIGLWFLLRQYLPDIDWGFVWPLAIVAVAGVELWQTRRGAR